MRVPLWIVAGMLASAMFVQAATTPFTFAIQPGPHAVGFRVVLQYDFSRTYRGAVDVAGRLYRGEVARPVQTLIWYPARKSARPTVRFGDYLALFATEENFSPTPDASVSLVRQGEKDFDADPSSSMWAVRDAMEEHGAWPVVIYAPSFTAPAFENADLCEYLASQGYVVIASPDMGAHGREMTMDLEGIDAQARDISFLIGFARTLPQANSSIAVAGYSWGGISNLFAAAKDERIKALVFLDGSARYFPKLVEDSKYVHPGEMSLPVIFFTQKDISLEAVVQFKRDVSRSVLNDMSHCDRIIVDMYGMSHGDFSSLFQRSPHFWNARPSDDYSGAKCRKAMVGWRDTRLRFSTPN